MGLSLSCEHVFCILSKLFSGNRNYADTRVLKYAESDPLSSAESDPLCSVELYSTSPTSENRTLSSSPTQ